MYLYLDLRLARTVYWWYWFGTWDVGRRDGSHAAYQILSRCIREGDTLKGPNCRVDLTSGRAKIQGRTFALREADLLADSDTRINYDNRPRGLVLVYKAKSKTIHLLQPPFDRSLFSRLYVFERPDSAYFSLQSDRFPFYQVWRVNKP